MGNKNQEKEKQKPTGRVHEGHSEHRPKQHLQIPPFN